jgi:hypothetical protein
LAVVEVRGSPIERRFLVPRPPYCLPAVAALVVLAALAWVRPVAASDSTWVLPPVKVSGYLQLDYRQTFHGGSPHDFNARRARVSFGGKVHDQVGFNLGLQGDRPVASTTPVTVLDFIVTAEPASGWKMRIGQFKYEFDIEAREPDENYILIDRSWAANTVAGGMNGLSTPSSPSGNFRDRGIEVARTAALAGWKLEGVAGGYQGNGRATDDNNEFGYILRARASHAGLMFNYGWMSSPSDLTSHYLYSAWTAGLDHVWHWSHLRAEVYEGQLDPGSSDLEWQGGYVAEVARLNARMDLSARWQNLRGELGSSAVAGAVDFGARAWLLHGSNRTNSWVGIDYMLRQSGFPLNELLTSLNDGTGSLRIPPDHRRHLVVVRMQVAF